MLINPALLLESRLKMVGDFLGDLLGPAANLGFAACLSVHLHPAADDEPRRIGGGNPAGCPQGRPRAFAAARLYGAAPEFSQPWAVTW